MEIPFKSTTAEFEQEFKKALGFTDIDIPYNKIRPELTLSANELIATIGKTTYDDLIANYKKTSERNEAQKDAFQYAIAAYAYMLFAPANDLAHTPNGRRMRSTENEKTPFPWMLANDNDNLQKRAYKAVDSLIKYLDENNDVWKESDEYKATFNLFVRTVEDFSAAYVLESRLLLLKLVPGLLQCEKREIQPRIGKTLSDSLKSKIQKLSEGSEQSSEIPTEAEQLLIDYIREACAYYALSWALPRMQVNLFPEGVLQAIRSDRETLNARVAPQFPVIDQASKLFKKDADHALMCIEEELKKMFPPEDVNETLTNEQKYGFSEDDNFIST